MSSTHNSNEAVQKLTALYAAISKPASVKAGDIVQYRADVPREDRDLRQGAPGIVVNVFQNPPTNGAGGKEIVFTDGVRFGIFATVYAIDNDGDLVKCQIQTMCLEPYTGGVEIAESRPSAQSLMARLMHGMHTDNDEDGEDLDSSHDPKRSLN